MTDEFYDEATSDFAGPEHLAPAQPPFGVGRLVAIWARETGQAKGKDGNPYTYVETVTMALDDGPDGDLANDKIGPAPAEVEMRHSTTMLVSRLKGRATGISQTGVPLRQRPYIGRMNSQASKNNKFLAAYGISEPTDADREIINRHKDAIIQRNKALLAADEATKDARAFD